MSPTPSMVRETEVVKLVRILIKKYLSKEQTKQKVFTTYLRKTYNRAYYLNTRGRKAYQAWEKKCLKNMARIEHVLLRTKDLSRLKMKKDTLRNCIARLTPNEMKKLDLLLKLDLRNPIFRRKLK